MLVAGGSSTRRPHTRHNSSSGHGAAAAAASHGRPPPPAAECVPAPAVFCSPATPRHHSYLLHRRHYANESRDGHVTREIFHTLTKYLTHAACRRAAATCTMHAAFRIIRIVDLPTGECSARGAGWCWLCLHLALPCYECYDGGRGTLGTNQDTVTRTQQGWVNIPCPPSSV